MGNDFLFKFLHTHLHVASKAQRDLISRLEVASAVSPVHLEVCRKMLAFLQLKLAFLTGQKLSLAQLLSLYDPKVLFFIWTLLYRHQNLSRPKENEG